MNSQVKSKFSTKLKKLRKAIRASEDNETVRSKFVMQVFAEKCEMLK